MRTRLLAAAIVAAAAAAPAAAETKKGTPDIKTISALAFGPGGVLFVGDAANATVTAVETNDTARGGSADVNVDKLDEKLGSMLGTTADKVQIADVKVNPASGNVFVAVARKAGGGPVVVKLTRDGQMAEFPLKDVSHSAVKLSNGKGEAITSMAFVDGKLVIAGLSTEEFASTLRAIPYPFQAADKGTGVEIYHGAHNKVETHAPIRTFVPYKVGGAEYLVAAYTCTPLVRVPVADLKPGAKVKGATIAELGNRNRPLDMVVYNKGGKDYILIANSARGVMKLPADGIASAEPITAKPKGGGATFGIQYETVGELKDVVQLDKLDDGRALLVVKAQDGNASLRTIPLP